MARRMEVWGTSEFKDLGRRLKAAGDTGKGLRKTLTRGLAKEAAPIVDAARANVRGLAITGVPTGGRDVSVTGGRGGRSARAARAAARLGKRKVGDRGKLRAFRGAGLRDTVARTVSSTVSVSPTGASLRVRANARKMPPDQRNLPALMNRGKIRHPVFRNRKVWAQQTMPKGWFDNAAKAKGPPARTNAVKTIRTYLSKLDI